MDPLDQLDSLAKRLSSLIPEPLQATQQDIESNLRSGLESGLRKMNLVTREEFDVQTAVLLRTREKLEQLEKRVAEMESAANQSPLNGQALCGEQITFKKKSL